MSTPYNLRPNPKPSQKLVESSGDNLKSNKTETHTRKDNLGETNMDDSTTLTAPTVSDQNISLSPIATPPASDDASSDEFTGYDSNLDIELANCRQMNDVIATHTFPTNASAARATPTAATATTSAAVTITAPTTSTAVTTKQLFPTTLPQQPITDENNIVQPQRFSQPSSPTMQTHIADQTEIPPADLNALAKLLIEFKTDLNAKLDTNTNAINSMNIKVDSLEAKIDTVKTDINSVKTEMVMQYNTLHSQIESLSDSHTKLSTEVDQIKAIQQSHTTKFREIETNFTTKLNENSYDLKVELKAELNAHKNEVNDTIFSQNKMVQDEIHSTLNTSLNQIKNEIQDTRDSQQKQISEAIKLHNTEIENQIRPLIKENSNQIEQTNKTIQSVTQTLGNKLESLQNDLTHKTNLMQPNIYVTCGNGTTTDLSLPKFSGREHGPSEFLKKLEKYYQRNIARQPPNSDPRETLIDTIEISLERNASRWFSLIKDEIQNWNDFEQAFLAKFWSREVQRGIKQRIENEKYRPGGKLTRSEYFIERVLTLKSMTPSLTEEEIVTLLAEHFSELIQDARSVQNANTITSFESLLQREDIKDSNRRIKQNSPTAQRRNTSVNWQESRAPPNQYQTQQNQYRSPRDNVNRHAYQPRFDRPNMPNNPPPNQTPNQNYQQPWGRQQQPYYGPPPEQYPPLNRSFNRNHESRYPTPEQRQVCTTVIERTNPPNTPLNKPSTPTKPLN